MSESLKSHNFKRQMYNRLVVIAIVVTILIVPVYLGMGAAFVLYYGQAYITAMYVPQYLLEQYWTLLQYWMQYHSQLGQDFAMRLVAPPAGGIVSSMILLFAIRAPL